MAMSGLLLSTGAPRPRGMGLALAAVAMGGLFLAWLTGWMLRLASSSSQVRFQVQSSSMAPGFLGPCDVAACQHCGEEFLVVRESTSPGWPIRCWACGGEAVLSGQSFEGDLCEIRPLDGPVERFEVIALEQTGQRMLKRVWGLPGEQLELRGGEMFIDNQPLQKTLGQLRKLAVHLSTWERRSDSREKLNQEFARIASVGRWTQDADTLSWQFLRPAPVHPDEQPVAQWLEPVSPTDEAPYLVAPAQVVHVDDLLVEMTFVPDGDSPRSLVMNFPYGEQYLQVKLSSREDGANSNGSSTLIQAELKHSLAIALCDGQVLVACDQSPGQRFALNDFVTRRGLPKGSLRLQTEGLELGRVEVYRDLVVHSPLVTEATARWDVPDDAYFVLGDCQSLSIDSRNGLGMIKRDAVFGKVRAIAQDYLDASDSSSSDSTRSKTATSSKRP